MATHDTHDLINRPRPPININNVNASSAWGSLSQAALYLVSFPVLTVSAARPGFRVAVSDKSADASARIGHVVMHISDIVVRST
jgi:hypothetical protein